MEGVHQLHIRVTPDEVELAVRELLGAMDNLASGFPANFLEWRQAQDKEAA